MDEEHELIRRMNAVEATDRHLAGRSWAWGKADCASMAAFHLKQLKWKLPSFKSYRTEKGARAALTALGAQTLADVIDGMGLRRITPAQALMGDLFFMPGTGPMGTLTIALGNGAMKGFHEDHEGLVVMRGDMIITAWSIMP